jgi:hypothetical protein
MQNIFLINGSPRLSQIPTDHVRSLASGSAAVVKQSWHRRGRYVQGPSRSLFRKKGSRRSVRFDVFSFFFCSPAGRATKCSSIRKKNNQTKTFLCLFVSAHYSPLSLSSSSATATKRCSSCAFPAGYVLLCFYTKIIDKII